MSIPLASLNFDTKFFELNPYLPPCLILEKGSKIYKLFEGILNLLNQKLDHLVDQYKKNYFDTKNPINTILQQINIIRQSIPKMTMILEQPFMSPYSLYIEIVSLYGNIICLDNSFKKEVIPSYSHEHILEIFSNLSKIILDKLECELPDDYLLLYFERHHDHFKFEIKNMIDEQEILIGFRKNRFFNEEDYLSFIKNLLICESSKFLHLKESRSLGLNRYHVNSQEGLFLNKDTFLFKIDITNEYFQKGSEIIIFSNSDKFEKLESNSIIFYNKTN